MFTIIPEKSFDISKKGAELTKSILDRSSFLSDLIIKQYGGKPENILGEFQVAFILFLIGENLEAFEQFKKIFILLCNSESYLIHNQLFAGNVVRVIFSMLKQFPADFFLDILSQNNFIQDCLGNLASLISDPKASQQLITKIKKLMKCVKDQFGLDINEEDDDFKPVIVDTNAKMFSLND